MDGAGADQAASEVSVVVAAFSGRDALIRCLDSLSRQTILAETIVVTDVQKPAADEVAARFPAMRFLFVPRGTNVFRLRSLGVEQATGRVILLTEDHCTFTAEWIEALSADINAGHAVVGGPVDNGMAPSTYGWALYFCEYLAWMPPIKGGTISILSGVNAAYDRDVLANCRAVWQEEFHENEVHDALRKAGYGLYLAEKGWVLSHLAMKLPMAMSHLFRGGRQYGGYRLSGASALTRALLLALSPAVPLVLFGRVVRRVAVRRPALLSTLLLGLPYLICLLGAWSLGEALGYLSSESSVQLRDHEESYAHRH